MVSMVFIIYNFLAILIFNKMADTAVIHIVVSFNSNINIC